MKQRLPEQFLKGDCAIVEIAGKQYYVAAGLRIFVDKLDMAIDAPMDISSVIALNISGKTEIGTPYVTGKTVKAKVISQERGEKLRVMRFRSKSNYHRSLGHRQPMTQLEIVSL